MAVNGVYGVDTANMMLEDLKGPIRTMFLRRLYGPAKLCKKVAPTGEAFSSRRLQTKHQSKGAQLYRGDEILPMVKDENLFETLKWAPMSFMVPIFLIGMDVEKARRSKTKIGELMKLGPAADLARLAIDLEEFMLTSRTFSPGTPVMSAADLANLNPFLGEYVNPNNGTGNARLGTDYGALKFETPAVQKASGHKWLDLARDTDKGWYNQHESITSFASDGEAKIQRLQRITKQRASDNTAPDRMLCTDGLFGNILATQRDAIRIVKATDDHFLKTGEAEITMYGGVAIETNVSFDVAQLTSVDAKFANGAAYMFNTHNGKWEYEEEGPLQFSKFRDVLDNQYRYTARLIHTCQITCQEMKAQGTLLGGDN